MTPGAIKRAKKAITLLLQASPYKQVYNPTIGKDVWFKLAFVTLTIPSRNQAVDAKTGYELLLKPFLAWLTRTKHCKLYIWKAELQKRGQLHYHLTTNSFIEASEIRQKWNQLLRSNNLLQEYYEEKGHYNPNSTDVHSVYNVNNLEAYLVKYLTKKDSNQSATKGKLWDCSQCLKKGKYYTFQVIGDELIKVKDLEERGYIKSKVGDYWSILFTGGLNYKELLNEREQKKFEEHIKKIRAG